MPRGQNRLRLQLFTFILAHVVSQHCLIDSGVVKEDAIAKPGRLRLWPPHEPLATVSGCTFSVPSTLLWPWHAITFPSVVPATAVDGCASMSMTSRLCQHEHHTVLGEKFPPLRDIEMPMLLWQVLFLQDLVLFEQGAKCTHVTGAQIFDHLLSTLNLLSSSFNRRLCRGCALLIDACLQHSWLKFQRKNYKSKKEFVI